MSEPKLTSVRLLATALAETMIQNWSAEQFETIFPRGTTALIRVSRQLTEARVAVPEAVANIVTQLSTRPKFLVPKSQDDIVRDLSADLAVALELFCDPGSVNATHPHAMHALRNARRLLSTAHGKIPVEVGHWLAKADSLAPALISDQKDACRILEFKLRPRSLT